MLGTSEALVVRGMNNDACGRQRAQRIAMPDDRVGSALVVADGIDGKRHRSAGRGEAEWCRPHGGQWNSAPAISLRAAAMFCQVEVVLFCRLHDTT